MSLFISVLIPSKELEKSPIDIAITVLAANTQAEKRNGRLPGGPALDITFMLPYKEDVPEFQGMRMGGYTSENQTLYFESAVPEHIVYSENATRYVLLAIQDAVENADEYFQECNVLFNKTTWYNTIESLSNTAAVLTNNN